MTISTTETARRYLELADPETRQGHREDAAIYVHYPFCRHLCTYCYFDKFAGLDRLMEPYMDAVVAQILGSPEVRATTLYVGGGTPSLMSVARAADLLDACRSRFGLPDDAETTLEANPSGLGQVELEGFRRAGFNRLSLGVQSADARLLRLLGRRHRHEDSRSTIEAARRAGFQNISVDLIYGLPYQSQQSWRETLEAVIGWEVEHISCYMLTVEAGTPLERGVSRGVVPTPSEDEAVEMYEVAGRLLAAAGYHRYEISNWAKPGRESAHNLVYWRNQPYLAVGAGAAGSWRGRRYKLRPDVAGYMEGVRAGRIPLSEDEVVDRHRSMSDSLILGLRLAEGVSGSKFLERYGSYPENEFGDGLGWGVAAGLLEAEGDRLTLSEDGILLSNELFERLL